jgi:hypothetical protein
VIIPVCPGERSKKLTHTEHLRTHCGPIDLFVSLGPIDTSNSGQRNRHQRAPNYSASGVTY